MKHLMFIPGMLCFLLGFGLTYGQNTIQGKVIDEETQKPIPDVTILTKDDRVYTLTDDDGNFELEPKNKLINYVRAVHMNYNAKRASVRDSIVTIVLRPQSNDLNEILLISSNNAF